MEEQEKTPDFVLIDSDEVIFMPGFSPATVVTRPGYIKASGGKSVQGRKVCVEGDETTVTVEACLYTSGVFTVAGMGTLKIQALTADQKATQKRSNGANVLLRGAQFEAVFEVTQPAITPDGSSSDPVKQYPGKGIFKTNNTKLRAN